MFRTTLLLALLLLLTACGSAQRQEEAPPPRLIGTCEGCEAVFEYGDRGLTAVDTLPDFHEDGQRIKISGTIYRPDGRTPAAEVILYVYHTDRNGRYTPREGASGWERRHGYNRAWLKTDREGRYTFYTLRPGSYPDRSTPAHIHPVILEPDGKYYWLGAYHFSDDPLLTEKERNPDSPRGGSSGLLTLQKEGDLWVGERDFVLGKGITGYQ